MARWVVELYCLTQSCSNVESNKKDKNTDNINEKRIDSSDEDEDRIIRFNVTITNSTLFSINRIYKLP